MANIVKKYRNKSDYTILATEKAYNLFYKKQGFEPVEAPDAEEPVVDDPDAEEPAASDSDAEEPAANDSDVEDPATSDFPPKKPAKNGKGKSAKVADKDDTEPEAPAESTQEE